MTNIYQKKIELEKNIKINKHYKKVAQTEKYTLNIVCYHTPN